MPGEESVPNTAGFGGGVVYQPEKLDSDDLPPLPAIGHPPAEVPHVPSDPSLKARSVPRRVPGRGWVKGMLTLMIEDLLDESDHLPSMYRRLSTRSKLKPFREWGPGNPAESELVDLLADLIHLNARQNGTSAAILQLLFERIARCRSSLRELIRYIVPYRPPYGNPPTPPDLYDRWLRIEDYVHREFK